MDDRSGDGLTGGVRMIFFVVLGGAIIVAVYSCLTV